MKLDNAIKSFQNELNKASSPSTKEWFENYLKGAIEYRGVKSPQVSKLLTSWRKNFGLDELKPEKQLDLAVKLILQKKAEDKFAGIFYIQKYLVPVLESKVILDKAELLFKKKAFWDWSTTDWFCVRVLDDLVLSDYGPSPKRVASWHSSSNMWQRRASIVSFRNASKDPKYHSLIQKTISKLVKEDERFIQTGIGWVISDLSKPYPKLAREIVEKHFDYLSKEVIRRHTKHLSDHKKLIKRKSTS